MRRTLFFIAVFGVCVALAALADDAKVKTEPTVTKVDRWVVACETRPDKDVEAVKAKAGALSLEGAKCHLIGSTGARDIYTCEGRDAAKMELSERGCVVYEYDGIKSITEATTKETLVRGSTCIGEATMTYKHKVKTYQIWPCAWNNIKPDFVVKRIDHYGPGVIGKGSLRQIVGLDKTVEITRETTK